MFLPRGDTDTAAAAVDFRLFQRALLAVADRVDDVTALITRRRRFG